MKGLHFGSAKRLLAVSILIVATSFGTSCQLIAGSQPPAAQPGESAAVTSATASTGSGASGAAVSASDFRTAVRFVAEQVKPAVVQITNEQTQVGMSNQAFTVPAGVGSGVIYDAQGHILTNNHVIEGAQSLLISLPDGRSFPGKLIGADPQTDLAVVQVTGNNLPVAQLGDSSQLQVGDWVVAIGNALALNGGPTVTAGVVSALGRAVQEPGSQSGGQSQGAPLAGQGQGPFLLDAIQTDTPINPGNSGGPLANLDGQVIGINTLVAGQAEPGVQAEGIGFAISINTAKPIADQLVANGKIVHATLGINYVPLDPSTAAQIGTTQTDGILITDVLPGSPAAQVGIQVKDIITKVDGTILQNDSDWAQFLNTHKPGDAVTLTVLRGTQTLSIKATLGELPSS